MKGGGIGSCTKSAIERRYRAQPASGDRESCTKTTFEGRFRARGYLAIKIMLEAVAMG